MKKQKKQQTGIRPATLIAGYALIVIAVCIIVHICGNGQKVFLPSNQNCTLLSTKGCLTEEQGATLLKLASKWEQEHGLVVRFAAQSKCSASCISLEKHLTHIRTDMCAADSDIIVIAEKNRKAAIIDHGTNTNLQKSSLNFNIDDFDEMGEELVLFARRIDTFLTGSHIAVGKEIAQNFDEYMRKLGYVLIDVSELNAEAFPDAVVKQAGNGHIELFCLTGTENDAGLLWQNYYYACINQGAPATFVQKWVPGDPFAQRSVEAVVNGQYVRAELIGGTCVSATTTEPTLASVIDTIMAGIGVPENTAVIN